MKALAFDLGDTLVEYAGLPLSWESYYPAALANLFKSIPVSVSEEQILACAALLKEYNTRIVPREIEVGFAEILKRFLAHIEFSGGVDEVRCARAFFSIFRQRFRAFPDSMPALRAASGRGCRLGIFTDVPYGMPRSLVEEDITLAGLSGAVDVLLTSVDAGFRKPSPRTLQALALALGSEANEMSYVGNERKDIAAALAFGCEAVLLDRAGQKPDWGQHRTISSLAEL